MGSVVQNATTRPTEPDRGSGIPTQRRGYREAPAQSLMHTFVGEQNISHFVDQFQIAHDPHTRQTLQKLLLEEENRFGFSSEQLERTQRLIKECQARIAQHERLIHKGRLNGHNATTTERVLNNLIELQEIFWSYHQVVLEAVTRSRP